MFRHSIDGDKVFLTLKTDLETTDCKISTSNNYEQFSLSETVFALQELFSLSRIVSVPAPFCDLKSSSLSLHGLVAIIFNNITSIQYSESVNDFLDTILILASDILKKKRQKEVKKDAQEDFSVVQETSKNVYAKEHVKVVNVTKAVDCTENAAVSDFQSSQDKAEAREDLQIQLGEGVAESSCVHELEQQEIEPFDYSSLIEQASATSSSTSCDLCNKIFEHNYELKCHLILDHIGFANWCELEPGLARELRCSECTGQFVELDSFKQHLDICPRTNIAENNTLLANILQRRSLNETNSDFCPVCERTLPSKNFVEHINKHLTGEDVCGQDFVCKSGNCLAADGVSSREIDLFSQTKSIIPENFYKCDECDIPVLIGTAYYHHMQICHIGLDIWSVLENSFEPKSCDMCYVEFSGPTHEKVHSVSCQKSDRNGLDPSINQSINSYRNIIEASFVKGTTVREVIVNLRINLNLGTVLKSSDEPKVEVVKTEWPEQKENKRTRKQKNRHV